MHTPIIQRTLIRIVLSASAHKAETCESGRQPTGDAGVALLSGTFDVKYTFQFGHVSGPRRLNGHDRGELFGMPAV